MNNARLYVMIKDNGTGRWFGLDRGYNLLIDSGDFDSACEIVGSNESGYQGSPCAKVLQVDDDFFPSMQHQAPAWGWYCKAMKAGFTAIWLRDREDGGDGVRIARMAYEYDSIRVHDGRFLEA
jgi:hypothetical protein